MAGTMVDEDRGENNSTATNPTKENGKWKFKMDGILKTHFCKNIATLFCDI